MNLKKTYTLAVNPECAKLIEEYKEKHKMTYTDIFIEGVKLLLKRDKECIYDVQ